VPIERSQRSEAQGDAIAQWGLLGVETVSTDIPTKSVHLRYDASQLSMAQIETTLDDVGYTVAKEPRSLPRTSGKPLNVR
jgi:copper chaperone